MELGVGEYQPSGQSERGESRCEAGYPAGVRSAWWSLLATAVSLGCEAPSVAPRDASSDAAVALDAAGDAAPEAVDVPPWRCGRARPSPRPPSRCNGHAALCERTLDAVSFATTHNAMSTRAERFTPPNHERAMATQLVDGVRAMMLDVHPFRDEATLCHGFCTLGRRRLAEGLCDVAQFADAHPDEVLVLIFESYVSGAMIEAAAREVDLVPDLHVQPAGAPWPTLGAMVGAGRRIVMLTDAGGGEPQRPWLHALWSHAFENPYAAADEGALSCAMNRGDARNALFIFNHFLTAPLAMPELAERINHNPAFLARARRCAEARGHLPNFVTVDFYETGDLFAVVRALNGLE
ncbi:MAG: hypothetical protein JNK72_05405 [Myxococcales bacterium]|nr:hypothetical protein [Myxococcales bacterium]